MSYRLITKASLSLAGNTRNVDVRAYAAPKGASVGEVTLNDEPTPFKLTGGQGRGSVVRCYMYFMLKGESAYIEITKDEMTDLRAGKVPHLDTITVVEAHAADEVARTAPAPESEPAPKATRKSRKVAA